MSRAHDARRKEKRRLETLVVAPVRPVRRRTIGSIALALLALGFAAAAIHALDSKDAGEQSRGDIRAEVTALFAGIPQHGATLGFPDAPVTLRMYADLECHTVRRYFLNHLPGLIRLWVRSGRIKLEFRSLQTDTLWETIFTRQQIAALAAGRQGKLWNFADTFVHEEGVEYTRYATEGFLGRVASNVSGLDLTTWKRQRRALSLFNQVVLADHHAREEGLFATPSFLIGPTGGAITTPAGPNLEIGNLLRTPALTPLVERIEREGRDAVPGLHS